MAKKETILVVCAHPDDEIIGCGGTIAKYAAEGKDIITVIFSYGESSHFWLKQSKIQGIRAQESIAAGKIIGTKETVFLGVADLAFKRELKEKPIIVDLVKELILKYKPAKIFTHSFDDVLYYDHRVTYDTVRKAIRRADYNGEVYTFNIWNPLNFRKRNSPKLVVDITQTFEKKVEALQCFKSQKISLVQLTPVVYVRAFVHGLNRGFKFAEVFHKIK